MEELGGDGALPWPLVLSLPVEPCAERDHGRRGGVARRQARVHGIVSSPACPDALLGVCHGEIFVTACHGYEHNSQERTWSFFSSGRRSTEYTQDGTVYTSDKCLNSKFMIEAKKTFS